MQRYFWLGISVIVTLSMVAADGRAQESANPGVPQLTAEQIASQLSGADMTPEIWLYLQESRRQSDPKQGVRRKAELRTRRQRQARLESQRWFGFSNLRPPANPLPYFGTYSPTWVGSGRNSYAWNGVGHPQ